MSAITVTNTITTIIIVTTTTIIINITTGIATITTISIIREIEFLRKTI